MVRLVGFVASALSCAASAVVTEPEPGPEPAPSVAPDPEPQPAFEWRHEFVSAPEAGLFAVVRGNTMLRKYPRVDSSGWSFDGGHIGVVRIVGRQAEFIEVELDWPTDPTVRHCLLAPLGTVGLRMFVLEHELADVTTAPMVLATGSDTGIVVAAGVFVSPSAGLHYRDLYSVYDQPQRGMVTNGDGLDVRTTVGLPAVGKFYAATLATSIRAPLRGTVPFDIEDDWRTLHRIDYGGYTLLGWGNIYAQSESDPNHVVVGVDCLQVAGHIDGAFEGRGLGGGTCSGPRYDYRPSEPWRLPAGTALTWETGGAAGVLHREVELDYAPRRRGKARCFLPPLDSCGSYEELVVCVPATAIQHIPANASAVNK
jgi:hypothetical protein